MSSWAILYPFTPLLMPKIKIWKKCKKTGYIIFLHMCAINEDHMMYGCWDIRQDIFFLFYSSSTLTTQKIKIFKKWKKPRGDIIISHKYTKNHDHMLYCSSDMVHDGWNCYFSLWATFCPKNQIFEKMENNAGDTIIYACVPKTSITWGNVPEIQSERHNFCHLGPFFTLLPHYWCRKLKFGKNVRKLDILSFYICVP